jgi:DNA-directed RNA polymerase subunit beta
MSANIKNFSKVKIKLSQPYLLSIQKENWRLFWERDLKELFQEFSPIRDYSGKEIELWFLDYKLDEPRYKTDLEARKNNDSYEAALRVRIKLVNLRTKKTQEQEVFLGDFPLMTERGTFIVNGVERVVISQLIRSSGAFFTVQRIGNKNCFGAKIIPNRGVWLEFETETSGAIGVKIDRRRKIMATTLLKALGGAVQDKLIKETFQDVDKGEIKFIEETLKKDTTKNQTDAFIEIYQRLRPGDLASADTAKELIENTFFNFERYDLSKVGRWRMYQRLPGLLEEKKKEEEIQKSDRTLKLKDIVYVIKEIIRLNNNPEARPDQIDHLGNRRVRTLNELLQNRLRVGLMRMERNIKDKISTLDLDILTPNQLINAKPFMAVIKEFFTSSQISQFMDSENPLSEIEHKRRLSSTGPGGLTRERAGFEVRDVQSSYYGKICPIQTSEGSNIGLVSHLASFTKINKYGFLETPYFKVEKGRVQSKIQYLNAYEEEKYNIAAGATPIDEKNNIIPQKVEARIKGEPGIADKTQIDFIDVSSKQSISVATSLIPFLQNNDARRALMASNMQRQAVPLINPDSPIIGTGVEKIVAQDSGQVLLAEEDGTIKKVDAKHIVINLKNKKLKTYYLKTFLRTNQYTCFHQKPIIKKGDKIKKGDVLTDGGAISQGILALGQNVLVAFMSWHGNNFEDAIIISDRLIKDDVYTSIHLESFVCDIRETKLGPEITTSDIPNVSEEKLKNLDEEGIVCIGAKVESGDILVGKISPKGEQDLTAEERLLKAIFGEKARDVKDNSLLMPHGKKGVVIEIKVFSREQGHKLKPGVIKRIEIEVAQIRKIAVGDKIAGRHGNKGVISIVLPIEEMPFTKDGIPVDIILNPISVASRMNLGQILEAHLGLAVKKLGYKVITPALAGANEEDIKKELKAAGFSEDGKIALYDGRTGLPFPEKITIGYVYMMKLNHMVEDKLHMRSIGPYSLITQQPLGGKAQFGGQRFGEMEVWALEGYGAAHTLQEMLTIKSDDIFGRATTYEAILKGEEIKTPNIPASFDLLVAELKSLGIGVEVKEKLKE